MTRVLDRRKAFELRKLGKSYSQIKSELGISKSTLSEWLRAYPLTKEQIDVLRGKSETRIEKYRETRRKTRETRLHKIYEEEKERLLPLIDRELYMLGLFLYWGEGRKADISTISLNNTDPSVVQFFHYWLTHSFSIDKEEIRVSVHLYADMDIETELQYWSKTLHIPRKQFTKPYIKKSKKSGLDQKGFGHGTCGLYVYDVHLKEKILAGIAVIKDYYIRPV